MAVTLSLFAGAGAQFFDDNGNPLSGGFVYTYAAGTTTPAVTYTTNSDAVFHSNPIVLNAAGRVPNGGEIWLQLGASYKFVVRTSTGVLVATYDNIPSSPQPPVSNDAEFIMYRVGYTLTAGNFVPGKIYKITSIGTTDFTLIGATSNTLGLYFVATDVGSGTGTAELAVSVQSKLRGIVSVKDYGAVGDGITNDTVAIQACLAAVGTTGTINIPAGNYLYSGTVYPVGTDFFWTNSNFTTGVDMMRAARNSCMLVTITTPDTSPLNPDDSRIGISITASGRGANHVDGIRSNLFNYSTDGNGNTAFYGAAVSAGTFVNWSAAVHGETKHAGGTSIGVSSENQSYEVSGSLLGCVVHNTTAGGTTHPITGASPVDCTNAYGVYIIGGNSSGTGIGGWRYGVFLDVGSMRAGGVSMYLAPHATVSAHIQTAVGSAASTADILLQANSENGLILNGTYVKNAIRLSNNSKIAWETTGAIATRYNTSTLELEFLSGSTQRIALGYTSSPNLVFNGTQVVGVRNTGWTAMTGSSNKASVFDTATVTLPELAQRVKTIQDALTQHGLIGA